MQIIDVYQPVHQGVDGRAIFQEEYYEDYDEAKKNCNGIGCQPEPNKLMGLKLEKTDAQVFIFASPVPVPLFKTTNDMKRARALAKLTPEDRKALGL